MMHALNVSNTVSDSVALVAAILAAKCKLTQGPGSSGKRNEPAIRQSVSFNMNDKCEPYSMHRELLATAL